MSALLSYALAAPSMPEAEKKAIYPRDCNHDNLYRSFVDPRYSASASSFCSTYIRPTVKTVATTTTTITTTATAANAKRDLPATTAYEPSRLSSACSCILTSLPTPTTVYTATVTSTQTATTTIKPSAPGCTNPATIVKNGGFETGSLSPWELLTVIPPLPDYEQYLQVGVTAPGFKSGYAFTANDSAASSYVEIDIGQTVSLCKGQTYKISAMFYMTDSHDGPQTYVTLLVDNNRVAASKASDAKGPPVVWTPLSGTFTAGADTAQIRVQFAATDYLGVQWAVDNVAVTPA
ncbi:MAG: hypothetical protein Q9190_006886 [Brigantiaea leucoxantha]